MILLHEIALEPVKRLRTGTIQEIHGRLILWVILDYQDPDNICIACNERITRRWNHHACAGRALDEAAWVCECPETFCESLSGREHYYPDEDEISSQDGFVCFLCSEGIHPGA